MIDHRGIRKVFFAGFLGLDFAFKNCNNKKMTMSLPQLLNQTHFASNLILSRPFISMERASHLQGLAANEFAPPPDFTWDALLLGQLLAHALSEELRGL